MQIDYSHRSRVRRLGWQKDEIYAHDDEVDAELGDGRLSLV